MTTQIFKKKISIMILRMIYKNSKELSDRVLKSIRNIFLKRRDQISFFYSYRNILLQRYNIYFSEVC